MIQNLLLMLSRNSYQAFNLLGNVLVFIVKRIVEQIVEYHKNRNDVEKTFQWFAHLIQVYCAQ